MSLPSLARAAWRARMRRLPLSGFERDFASVEPHTMLSTRRLARLHRSVGAIVARHVPGDLVECGVAAGGSAALLGLALARAGAAGTRRLWLYDSFEGMPEPSPERDPDYEEARRHVGTCRGEEARVRQLVATLCPDLDVRVVPGRYESTLPTGPLPERVALLHVDCDWHDSVKLVLETLWPRLSPGAIVQVDDYYCWAGCRRAVDDFLAAGRSVPLHRIDGAGVWLAVP